MSEIGKEMPLTAQEFLDKEEYKEAGQTESFSEWFGDEIADKVIKAMRDFAAMHLEFARADLNHSVTDIK
jgi:hypothetical protein